MGERYLRKLVVGDAAALNHAKGDNNALRRWARALLAHKTPPRDMTPKRFRRGAE